MKFNKALNITTAIALIIQPFSLAHGMDNKHEEQAEDQKKSSLKQALTSSPHKEKTPEEIGILPQRKNLSLEDSKIDSQVNSLLNDNDQDILADREEFPTLSTIMPDEQLRHLTGYFKSKGRQDYQLQELSPFLMTNQLRWVENIKNLNLSYGSKRRELTDAALLPFIMNSPNSIELDKIGMMLKIMNGYYNNFDKSSEHSFNLTPDKTNFLVPYISFLIQCNSGEKPKFIPGGYLSFHKNKRAAAVFVSGRGDDLNNFSAFYNFILRTEKEVPIELIAGEDIKHLKIIRYLQKSEERFPVNLLRDVFENFYQKLQVKKKPKNDEEEANNKILHTSYLLYLIYSHQYEKAANERADTLKILDSRYDKKNYKDTNTLMAEIQKDMDDSCLQKGLYDSAIRRMEKASKNLQDKSFDEVKNYIQLFSSFHSEKIGELQSSRKAKEIYKQLSELNSTKVTKHFDDQGGQTDKHTEPWLIQTLTHKPKSLLRLLEKVEIPEGAAPKLKLIAIDMHSWLDVCHKYPNCMRTLYDFKVNGDWPKVLLSLQSALLSKGFRQNSKNGSPKPLRSVFRIFSERKYQSHPIELEGAGGGPKLLKHGFDAKLVSDLGLILAARRLPEDTKLRDSMIENIWHRIQNACLWHLQNFWYENRSIWERLVVLSTGRPGALNGLVILNKLYGQAEIAFPLALVHQLHQTDYECNGLSQKHLLLESQTMLESCIPRLADIPNKSLELLNFAYNRRYYLREYSLEYAELYLAETYLKLADIFLTENGEGRGREGALELLYQWTEKLKYKYNWLGRKLDKVQYEHDSPLSFDSPEFSKKIYERVINYTCKRASDLRNEVWGSPQEIEKSNITKALTLIKDLAQRGDDEAQSILQYNKSTLKQFRG